MTAPVVVGVDGSIEASQAAMWAGSLAAKIAAPLHLLHAKPYLGHNLTDASAALHAAAAIAQQDEDAATILRTVEHALREKYPTAVVTTAAVSDAADDALVAASRSALLVVVGCEDVSAVGALLVGSATLDIVGHAECPVVAWRGDCTQVTDKPIVVGVDESAPTRDVLAIAFELADGLRAPLHAVHCWQESHPVGRVVLPDSDEHQAMQAAQWQQLSDILDPWSEGHPDVNVTLIGTAGEPSEALLQYVQHAQLVVVGSRRRNVLSRKIFGSTSLSLLHHAKVPVVVCPMPLDD